METPPEQSDAAKAEQGVTAPAAQAVAVTLGKLAGHWDK